MARMRKLISIGIGALAICCTGCEPQVAPETESDAQVEPAPQPDQPIENPFPAATELRLFVETDYTEDGTPIMSKPAGLLLNEEQRAAFEAMLRAQTPDPDGVEAACFIPHHFFRYFNAAGEQIGEIEVCFCCLGVRGNVEVGAGQELSIDYVELEAFISSLGEPINILC